MRREVNLDPNCTYGFTRSAEPVVLYVGPLASLDERIASHFPIFGHVDYWRLEEEARRSWVVETWVDYYRKELGMSPGYSLPPGYYLFLHRAIGAYDVGLPKSDAGTDDIIREFDTKIARFRLAPWLASLPRTPETNALELVVRMTPPDELGASLLAIAAYEISERLGRK